MLLCYEDEQVWERAGSAALKKAMGEAGGAGADLNRKGQYVLASPLQPVATATSVRVQDGKRVVTDGPFAETREVLGGFFLIDVPSLDDALDAAERHARINRGTVEVRPVLEID